MTKITSSPTEAAKILTAGEVVGIPTETVYGLAGNALNAEVVAKIFSAKKRPSFDPLIVHLKDFSAGQNSDFSWTDTLEKSGMIAPVNPHQKVIVDVLLRKFWPGPLTILLPRNSVGKNALIPDLVTAGLPKVGLRVPAHPVTQTLLKSIDFPLAAPSANRFGKISPTSAPHVLDELGGRIPLILDGGPCSIGVESTVLELDETNSFPRFLLHRPGGVSLQTLKASIPNADFELISSLDQTPVVSSPCSSDKLNLASPGTSLSHYAPRTPLRLLSYPTSIEKIENELTRFQDPKSVSWALLTYAPLLPGFLQELKAAQVSYPKETRSLLTHSESPDSQAAQALFRSLREMDNDHLDVILAESPPNPHEGLQHAIYDRLKRASFVEQ